MSRASQHSASTTTQRARPGPSPTIQLLSGVCEEAVSWFLCRGINAKKSPLVNFVLARDSRRVGRFAAELETWIGWQADDAASRHRVLTLPNLPDTDTEGARAAEILAERQRVLSALSELCTNGKDSPTHTIVTTPEACFSPFPARETFDTKRLLLTDGDVCAPATLAEKLADTFGYDNEVLCEYPGQYAVRGGIVDLFPFDAEAPVRLDFFGDEIESIRQFDPVTQRTTEAIGRVVIHPVTGATENALEPGALASYLIKQPVGWYLIEPADLTRAYPLCFEAKSPRRSYPRTFANLKKARDPFGDQWTGLCELDTQPRFFKDAEQIVQQTEPVSNYRPMASSAMVGAERQATEEATRKKFEGIVSDWSLRSKRKILVVLGNQSEGERIRELWQENPATRPLKPTFLKGRLGGGFLCRLPEKSPQATAYPASAEHPAFVILTDDDYFGRQRHQPTPGSRKARPAERQIDHLLDFAELADGDALVHLQHGICLYRGLSSIEVAGGAKEVITVEFAEKVSIHVPLHESHLLTRYVGLTKSAPKLGKLGGAQWQKTRRSAELATIDFASAMLRLDAARAHQKGFQFAPDNEWQRAFEGSFPHRTTRDQQRAIDETKQDMESDRPMDRLICGDVGFGKTEVALRAAMKAVLSGKQVAVLVPTTVLCQQHFQEFRERMAEFPITVEMVSRFRTAGQNKAILANLAEGRIDIVIGTHRLLSRDVHFPNLGLVIVDEEQRFGVRQKERLKQIRTETDLLTLSATPIPRTLYLALSGARAMSVIETAPVNRLPIQTIVRNYDEETVKRAIQAELSREGQVFYLHNRIDTIEKVAAKLKTLAPKARIGVGHGQMEEHQLEKVMTRFVAGQFDILVCTTIIESGLNIPNCNTLIIEGADRFGLSQLYQIRGRVGRFNRQAYAYLLLHRHAGVLDQARKRLSALRQHNQLGAGFRIAMRDLELRGAGNLLGSEQSGHIAGVGFELYCQLLRQSVARLKGEAGSDRIRAEVKLDFIATGEGASALRGVSGSASFAAIKAAEYAQNATQTLEASLPPNYIREPRLRIDLYRRLAMAEQLDSVDGIEAELADRFGALPEPSRALLEVTRIRILAELAGVRRVETERERLLCYRADASTPKGKFLHPGNRFPRLTKRKPAAKLTEIKAYLKRHLSA